MNDFHSAWAFLYECDVISLFHLSHLIEETTPSLLFFSFSVVFSFLFMFELLLCFLLCDYVIHLPQKVWPIFFLLSHCVSLMTVSLSHLIGVLSASQCFFFLSLAIFSDKNIKPKMSDVSKIWFGASSIIKKNWTDKLLNIKNA